MQDNIPTTESENSPTFEYLEEYKMWWPTYDQQCQRHIDYWKRHENDWKPAVELCKQRKVCIQAGGSVGEWPRMLAEHFDFVYTFEPHPDLYQCLVRNCTAENVIKFQAVLGEKRGPIQMRWKSIGAHWVLPEIGPYPTILIDDLNLPHCDLIILDVEGFETMVLKGAKETIEKFSPVIQLEDKDVEYRHNLPANTADAYMLSIGYTRGLRVGDDRIYTRCKK